MLAIIFNDYPEEWRLLQCCVYGPAFTIAASWFLIRWNRRFVFTALTLATISAGIVLMMVGGVLSDWVEMLRKVCNESHVRAVWFSVTFPYVMIALFYFSSKKQPNHTTDPTTRSVTPPASAGDRAAAGPGSS